MEKIKRPRAYNLYSSSDIAAATAEIVPILNGPTRQYVFKGTITTPEAMGTHDMDGLKNLTAVHIVMVDRTDPDNPVDREVYVFRGPLFPEKVMAWESTPFPLPVSGPTLIFTPLFRCADGTGRIVVTKGLKHDLVIDPAEPTPYVVAPPTAPTNAAIAVLDQASNFGLRTSWTNPATLGSTVGYDREVRYYADASAAAPISDWIALGTVGTDIASADSGWWPRPTSAQHVQFRIRGFNSLNVKTPWVYSLTPLPAISPVGAPVQPTEFVVALAEVGFDGATQTPRQHLTGTRVNGPTDAKYQSLYIESPLGSVLRPIVAFALSDPIDFWVDRPATNTPVRFWLIASKNDYYVQPDKTVGVASNIVTLPGVRPPAANDVTNAKLTVGSPGVDGNGGSYWGCTIEWDEPVPGQDGEWWRTKLYVRVVNAAGAQRPDEYGQWRPVSFSDGIPGQHVVVTITGWPIPAATDPYRIHQFQLLGESRAAQTTAQTVWPGGTDHVDIDPTTIAEGGFDSRFVKSSSLGRMLVKDPITGQLRMATDNDANLLADPGFELGGAQWTIGGSVALSTALVMTGTKAAKITGNYSLAQQIISCRPGETYYAEEYLSADWNTDGIARIYLQPLDAAKNWVDPYAYGEVTVAPGPGTWVKASTRLAIPAGASYLAVWAWVLNNTVGAWYVDNVYVSKVDAIAETDPTLVPPDNAANLIRNGSFELDDSWTFRYYGDSPAQFYYNNDGAYSGTRCLKLMGSAGANNFSYAVSKPIPIKKGEKYHLSCRFSKTVDLAFMAPDHYASYGIILTDKDGTWISSWAVPGFNESTVSSSGWSPAGFDFEIPSTSATHMCFQLAVLGCQAGALYMDAVEIRRIADADVLLVTGGLTKTPDGYVQINPGSSIDTQNGQVSVKLGALTSGFFAAGALGDDLTKYSQSKKPMGVYYGMPSPADPTVPDVILGIIGTVGKLYRRVNGAWDSGVDPGDIVAGQIASGVLITGTCYANRLVENGGGITGCRLQLNLNGVTSNIANMWDASYGGYSGLLVQLNGSNARALVSYAGIAVVNIYGYRTAEFSNGYAALANDSGTPTIQMFGANGQIICQALTFAGYGVYRDASGYLRA